MRAAPRGRSDPPSTSGKHRLRRLGLIGEDNIISDVRVQGAREGCVFNCRSPAVRADVARTSSAPAAIRKAMNSAHGHVAYLRVTWREEVHPQCHVSDAYQCQRRSRRGVMVAGKLGGAVKGGFSYM